MRRPSRWNAGGGLNRAGMLVDTRVSAGLVAEGCGLRVLIDAMVRERPAGGDRRRDAPCAAPARSGS